MQWCVCVCVCVCVCIVLQFDMTTVKSYTEMLLAIDQPGYRQTRLSNSTQSSLEGNRANVTAFRLCASVSHTQRRHSKMAGLQTVCGQQLHLSNAFRRTLCACVCVPSYMCKCVCVCVCVNPDNRNRQTQCDVQCDSFGTRPKKMRISQRLFIRF